MDWTTVAVAAITGAVGYAGAWKQSQTSVHQASEETQRIRLQHVEEHLRNRQGTYHQFLKSLRELDSLMIGWAPITEETLAEWRDRYVLYRSGIDLFGTGPVIAATGDVADALTKAFPRVEADPVRQEAIRRTYREHRRDVTNARNALTEAMRADVALPYTDDVPYTGD
jgi:hypothetical protein